MKRIGLFCIIVLTVTAATAQIPSVFVELATPDSVNKAVVKVKQSQAIADMVKYTSATATTETVKGYRVQVFSGNRGQISRERAFLIEKEILAKFSNMDIYVTYVAPFWKVRIGNCRTQEEAVRMRDFITEEFPDYKTETYIVPEKIIIE